MIEVQNLHFVYADTTQPALKGISFTIERGEIFGLLGPSGAGKSTTQKILIGLLKEYQGTVRVLGQDLKTWNSEYYEQIGVSFELPNHYLKLTAMENLRYFQSLYSGVTDSPQQVLAMVDLAEDGDKRVSQFSKGMRIRLNVARSLLNKPRVLFLDEPTSGLDPVNAQRIKELIQRKKADGTTIFLTTHNMNIAEELCDRVAFIIDGEIKLIDTPRSLKLHYGKRLVRIEYGINGTRQSQEFPLDGLAGNEGFLNVLQKETVQTMHTQETTLENIFIEVTGRSLA